MCNWGKLATNVAVGVATGGVGLLAKEMLLDAPARAAKKADRAQAAINAEAQAIKDQAAKKKIAKAPTQTIFAGNLSEGVTLGQ